MRPFETILLNESREWLKIPSFLIFSFSENKRAESTSVDDVIDATRSFLLLVKIKFYNF